MRRFTLIITFLLIIVCSIPGTTRAQQIVLKPDESITQWYNFQEWIFSNANIAFRTMDFGSFEAYTPGYTSGLESSVSIWVDDVFFQSGWIGNDFMTLPNFNPSDIDSVVINLDAFDPVNDSNPAYQIRIYTRNDQTYIAAETGRLNQIDDPGMFGSTPNPTPNVEFISFPTNITLNVKRNRYRSLIHLSSELYSRTDQIGYDQNIRTGLFNRTRVPESSENFEAQRNHQQSLLWLQSLDFEDYRFSLMGAGYQSDQFYLWQAEQGIEAPFSMDQYQLSGRFESMKDGFHRFTQLTYSRAESDTLDFSAPATITIGEEKFVHLSEFRIPLKDNSITFNLNTRFHSFRNRLTGRETDWFTYGVTATAPIEAHTDLQLSAGNEELSVLINYRKHPDIQLQFVTAMQVLNGFFNAFASHNPISPLVVPRNQINYSRARFVNTFSQIQATYSYSDQKHRLQSTAQFRHFWELTHREVILSERASGPVLSSEVNYSVTAINGILYVKNQHSYSFNPKFSLRSMLDVNLLVYGNRMISEHFSGVPTLLLAESLHYRVHENFGLEIFYKFIPSRTFTEYENLNNNLSDGRAISMLNLSSSMKFFDQRLELKTTLRNLLNSTEAYDTNGMYYGMSIYISGRIHFGF